MPHLLRLLSWCKSHPSEHKKGPGQLFSWLPTKAAQLRVPPNPQVLKPPSDFNAGPLVAADISYRRHSQPDFLPSPQAGSKPYFSAVSYFSDASSLLYLQCSWLGEATAQATVCLCVAGTHWHGVGRCEKKQGAWPVWMCALSV